MADIELPMCILDCSFFKRGKTSHKDLDLQVSALIVRKRTSANASADGSLVREGQVLMATL